MLVSVATAIADIIDTNHLKYDYIIPKVDDPSIIHIVTDTLTNAVQKILTRKYNNDKNNDLKRFNYAIDIVIAKIG